VQAQQSDGPNEFITSLSVRWVGEVLRIACLCMSVSLCVCLFACISQEPHFQISRNFLYMLPVAVARSSSNNRAIRYVLPVLWMTSCFHYNGAFTVARRQWLSTRPQLTANDLIGWRGGAVRRSLPFHLCLLCFLLDRFGPRLPDPVSRLRVYCCLYCLCYSN